jgi:hypothetical protein
MENIKIKSNKKNSGEKKRKKATFKMMYKKLK